MTNKSIISHLQDSHAMMVLATILVGLTGYIAAAMANRRVAVFNDGVRPLVGEERNGRLKHKMLAGMSVAMSIGYVIGFLPLSVTAGFLIVHIVLLGSDMIGLAFPNKKFDGKSSIINKFFLKDRYMHIAGILGFIYAISLYWGLKGLDSLFDLIAYKGFSWDLGTINAPFGAIFALFPSIAIALQHGWKKGGLAMLLTLITYATMSGLYSVHWSNQNIANIFKVPEAWSLLVGVLLLLFFAFKDKKNKESKKVEKSTATSSLFNQNGKVIIKNRLLFTLSGAIIGMAVTALAFVESPASAPLYSEGNISSALLTEGTRVLGFVPLVMLTALATGVYSPAGVKLSMFFGTLGVLCGLSIAKATGNENMYYFGFIISGVISSISMFVEVTVINKVSEWLDRYQGVKDAGGHIRTSITRVLNVLLLVSAAIAAWTIGSHVTAISGFKNLKIFGVAIVIGLSLMNKFFKKPLPEMAVGPAGLILVGVIFNIVRFIEFI